MRETVIVSAVRTPTGKFLGGLKDFSATQLGAMAVREAVRRAGSIIAFPALDQHSCSRHSPTRQHYRCALVWHNSWLWSV